MRPLLFLTLAGCAANATPLPDGEALARTHFGLGATAVSRGVSVTTTAEADPALTGALASWLGAVPPARGVRAVASFSMPLESVDPSFWTEWSPMPLPGAVLALPEGPAELVGLPGYYRCAVRSSSPSAPSGWASSDCDRTPANVDAFEVAAYDPVAGVMTVVIKQYY